MRLTRPAIMKQCERVRAFLREQEDLGTQSTIWRAAVNVCRSSNICLNFEQCEGLLADVQLFYDDINNHWAETDGYAIFLNMVKEYDEETLYMTLLHEALHGLVLRDFRYELSEEVEHRMMRLIDPSLI